MTAVVLELLLSTEVTERLLGGREEFKPGRSHIHLWLRFHSHLELLRQPFCTLSTRAIILCTAVSRTAHSPHKPLTEINLTDKSPFSLFLLGPVSRGQAGAHAAAHGTAARSSSSQTCRRTAAPHQPDPVLAYSSHKSSKFYNSLQLPGKKKPRSKGYNRFST